MIKFRLTFVDDTKGNKELENTLKILENEFSIINKSRIYKGRGESKYCNIYIDVEEK